ncbi:hypothetical protein, partial [Streptomyces mirabilis]
MTQRASHSFGEETGEETGAETGEKTGEETGERIPGTTGSPGHPGSAMIDAGAELDPVHPVKLPAPA